MGMPAKWPEFSFPYVDIVGVTGSIPVAPTISFNDLKRPRLCSRHRRWAPDLDPASPTAKLALQPVRHCIDQVGRSSSRSSAKSKFTFRRSEFQYVRLGRGHWSVAEREADDETDNV